MLVVTSHVVMLADQAALHILNAGEDTEFEDAEGAGMEASEDDDDMAEEDMLDEEEIAEALEAEEGQMQLQVIDEQAFQEVVNDLAASDPASAAALRYSISNQDYLLSETIRFGSACGLAIGNVQSSMSLMTTAIKPLIGESPHDTETGPPRM